MSAHYAHATVRVVLLEELVEGGVHAVIVDGACERLPDVEGVLACADEVFVDFPVVAGP